MACRAIASFLPFVVLLIIPAASAVTYTVGGRSGWDTNVDYSDWASTLTFTTADSLVFNYDGTHTVDEVNAADYESCSSANPISVAANSPTTIALTTAGTRYFVCLRSNHCAQGMKLAVTVTAPGSPSPPSGTTPSPPSSGATPSPPSETPETPTTTPSPTNAATNLGGRSSFIVGSLLVLAAGLMG